MKTCFLCKKSGFFLKLNSDGLCKNCEEKLNYNLEWALRKIQPYIQDEYSFFKNMLLQMEQKHIPASYLQLQRLSDKTITVYFSDCYIGRILLSSHSTKERYSVIKVGAKRAYKTYENKKDAQEFLNTHPNYELKIIPGKKSRNFMQWLKFKSEFDEDIIVERKDNMNEYVDLIPHWISYYNRISRYD